MSKVDYDLLEREYVTTDISIRALAQREGMSWSAVADQARKREWSDKRLTYRREVSKKTIARDAKQFVSESEDLNFEMIQAARAIIYKVLEGMRDGTILPQPRDALLAMDKLQLLTGKATERTEAQVVGITSTGGYIDDALLRRLEELTRGQTGLPSSAPKLRIEGTKPN
jgi:hypothetical protein